MGKNLLAIAITFGVAFSTSAAPATAAVHSSAGSTGVMSVIRRALERREMRLADMPAIKPRSSQREMDSLHKRVVERAKSRERAQSTNAKEAWQPDLAETLYERHSKSISRRRDRATSAEEQRLQSVEKRKRLRQMQRAQEQREQSGAQLKRSTIQMQREKRAEQERAQRLEERKELRTKKVGVSQKRDQYAKLRMQLLEAVNRERIWAGLPALTYNRDLEMSAQLHAEDMLVREYFDHFSPEGLSHVDRIKSIGYANVDIATCDCTAFKAVIGENIAKGQRSINWVMNEWMESPSHRRNILSSHFAEMGVGIADKVWVQNFGSVELTPR
jgi:uncharacterized protein YkwD